MAEPTEADRERAKDVLWVTQSSLMINRVDLTLEVERERAFNEGALAGMALVRESRAAEGAGQ